MGSDNTGIGLARMAWMKSVNRWRGQESDAEITFITDLAAEWAYEKNSVKDLLKEPASSGLVGCCAGAIRTREKPAKLRLSPQAGAVRLRLNWILPRLDPVAWGLSAGQSSTPPAIALTVEPLCVGTLQILLCAQPCRSKRVPA